MASIKELKKLAREKKIPDYSGMTKSELEKSLNITEEKEPESSSKKKTVRVFMHTSYKNIVKEGQVWETDEAKAKELIALGRARLAKKGE